jgi:hypothetical protein
MKLKDIKLPVYTLAEELLSSISHGWALCSASPP